MREEASFRMFFEKVKESKRKLEIDDPELPLKKKRFENLYLQLRNTPTKIFISADMLL